MEKALDDSHLPVPSVQNITLDSVGEEVVNEKKDVKDEVNDRCCTSCNESVVIKQFIWNVCRKNFPRRFAIHSQRSVSLNSFLKKSRETSNSSG